MSLMKGLISVAVIAGIGFLVCFLGGVSIDGCSKSRDAAIEETVSSVAARTDAAAADAATALEQVNTATAAGAAGKEGKNGTACWDVDPDGECDLETEDVNGDGDCDVLDCRGEVGPKGDRGKPGFGVKIRIGGKNGRDGKDGRDGKPGKDGKDCVGGGECVFTSVCCTDDGDKPSTVTAEPAKPTKPEPAKKPGKAKKPKFRKIEDDGVPNVRFENKHTVTVRINGEVVEDGESSSEPTPAAEMPTEIENRGGTVYINNSPVNVRIGN